MLRVLLVLVIGLAAAIAVAPTAEAQLSCYVFNSPQCRALAACEKRGGAKTTCNCMWQILSERFPKEQHELVAEMLEAAPRRGASSTEMMEAEQRRLAIAARAGFFQFSMMMADAMMKVERTCK